MNAKTDRDLTDLALRYKQMGYRLESITKDEIVLVKKIRGRPVEQRLRPDGNHLTRVRRASG